METKEVTIQIPKGYEIDKENSTFEKIVFKKKDTKPRSWEEYCKNNENKQVWFVKEDSSIGECHLTCRPANQDRNALSSKELAEAFLAMMQLMSLRQEWIGDWEPDWSKETSHKNPKYCVIPTVSEGFSVEPCYNNWIQTLSFPTKEMAVSFMNCFRDLLEIAKPLI